MKLSHRLSTSLLSSRFLAACITLVMAFALLPAMQPDPVEAQDFDEHTIIKRECPPGFDPGSGSPQNAFDNCTVLHPGISFTLSSQDPAYQGVVRTTDVGGTTGWADIPAGSAYSIAESLPAGYGDPWVFCRIYEQLDDSGQSVEFYFQAPGGAMDVGLSDPSLIALRDATCYWFNVPPAAAEPVETAAPEEPAETATTVTIQKRQCPFRYPYEAVALTDLQTNCASALRDIAFHINDDPATRQLADVNGQLVFENVPFGPVSIREEAYGSYDTARVFCQSHPSSDTSVVFDPANEVPFTAEGGDTFVVNVEATQGNKIDCLWFNAHVTEEDLGSLIITKYVCSEADDAIYVSLAELTHSCPEPQIGAYFELVQPGSISGGETDSNGVRPFQNYSPGAYDLRETEPAGYATARVFCYEHPGGTQVGIPDEFQEYTVTNQNQISIELKAGVELDCYWINIRVDENAGWVYVHKYYCNVSTNPAFASREGLLEACDRSLVGIPFLLANQDGTYQSTQTILQNGVASWYDAPPGNLTLTETIPTGYQIPRVFCGTVPQAGGAPPSMDEQTYDNGLAFTMAAGSIYVCEFFNTHIVEDTNGFVDVYKALCPPDFDHAAATTRDEFAQACSERVTGVQFDIAGPNGYARTGTSDFGTAFFQEPAPAGTLTITETPAQGQTLVRVFCGEAPYIGIGAIPDEWTDYADAAQVEFELSPGYQLVCEWYNIAAGPPSEDGPGTPQASDAVESGSPVASDTGGARIQKYVCPAGYDASINTFEAYQQACSEPQAGVVFEFAAESGTTSGSGPTNEEGISGFGGYPAGQVTMKETPPTGYRLARIYCQSYPQGTQNPDPANYQEQPFDASNLIEIELQGGYQIDCVWFNELVPEEGTGTIVFAKNLCGAVDVAGVPAGDLFEFLSSECMDPGSGFNFTLQASGGDVPGEADLDGLVTWPDLAPGDVTVSEGQNGPYSSLGAYCTTNPDRTSDFEEYAAAGETSFDYTVTAGEVLYCNWFDKTTEELTVLEIVKFACPAELTDPAASYEDLRGACPETQSDVQFSVNDELGYVSYKSTNSEGLVSWTSISPGGITIQEYPSPSEFPAAVFCSERPPDQTSYGPFQRVEYSADQERILYTMNANRPVACHWFNLGSDTDYGTVSITKYNCPEPTGPGEISDGEYGTLCTDPGEGYSFSLQSEEGDEVDQATSGADGKVTLFADAEGTYRVVEQAVPGYVTGAVHCNGENAFDEAASSESEFWTSPLTFGPGVTWDCAWYNVPLVETDYDPGSIVIHKFDCPPGYPDDGVDLDGLVFGCQAPNSEETFSVFQNDQPVGAAATDFSGTAVISNVPSGAIRISELPKEGFDPPHVFCTTYAPENGVPLPGYNEQTVENWGHTYELADGHVIECYWFNLPRSQGQPDEPVQIIIHKYLCAEGYDPNGQPFEAVSAACAVPEEGVDFRVQSGTPPSVTGPTDVNGYVEFNGVPPEFLSIDEVPRQGYQTVAVYCSAYYTNPGSYNALPAPNGQFAYYLAPGYALECNWYNAPVEQVGHVTVIKYLCPADYDYAGKSQSELKSSCTERVEGIPFTLSAGPDYSQTSSTDQNGEILWEDVPAVPLTIQEEPAGTRLIRVFCGETPIGDPESPTSQWDDYSPTSGAVFGPHVSPGHHLYCEVYNLPGEQNPPQVWLQKYNCPEEAEYHWTYQQLLPACLTPAEGVRFEYKREGGQFLEIDTDALGRAQLTGLEPNTWIITERFPDGYDGVAVFCQFITPQHAGAYQRAQVYNGEIALELDYDYVVTCVWFDFLEGHAPPAATPPAEGHQPLEPTSPGGGGTGGGTSDGPSVPSTGGAGQGTTGGGQTLPPVDPDAPATLIITKYTCAPLYDVHLDASDPAVDCDTLTDEVAFTLTNEDETDPVDLQGVTGDDEEGQVSFSELAPGPYLLTEELPEGTLSAFIYTCQSDRRDFELENPFTPFAYAGPDGRLGVTLEPGETLECAWYDVPAEQAGGQVTIVKYACPGTSVIVAQCEPFPDGATIGLFPVGDSGESIELVTGEDGTATAAVEGTYTLQELPDTACLVDSDAFDAAGNLVVNEGDEVEVRVYNCGLETETQE